MSAETERRVKLIAEAVSGISYREWRNIVEVVEQKFSPARSKAILDADAGEIENAIRVIPAWPD